MSFSAHQLQLTLNDLRIVSGPPYSLSTDFFASKRAPLRSLRSGQRLRLLTMCLAVSPDIVQVCDMAFL